MNIKINLKQLQLFIAVAEHDNLTLGAKAVFLSQPAASSALAELETQLGVPLFDRRGKRLVLNDNGTKLYPKAIELIDRSHHIETLFRHQDTSPTGHLRIGASSTLGNYVMPNLIARFNTAYPHITLTLKIANSETIMRDLEKFQLDIGFIESECHSKTLDIEPWGMDELIVFTAKHHPLAQQKSLSRHELEAAEWVLREPGSGTREALEKYFYPKHIRLEVGSTQAIQKIVAASQLLGCASRHTLTGKLEQHGLVALNIPSWSLKRHFYRLIHCERYHTALIEHFLQYFSVTTTQPS